MEITFYGATEDVTGSNILVKSGQYQFLIDCGLVQGSREHEKINWQKPPYEARTIDFVVVTHSHIDHIGRLPLLYKLGFRKKIYLTEPAAAFAKIFLEDTYKVMSEIAEKERIAELYALGDVEGVVALFETHPYYKTIKPVEGIELKFYDAGHILGAAIVEVKTEGKTIVFSGDLGNPPVPIVRDTDFVSQADYVVMEATYGDRNHEPFQDRKLRLERIIEQVIRDKGVLLVPAFAMERTQEIIFELSDLIKNKKIGQIPVYIDSPLAQKATDLYKRFASYFDPETKRLTQTGQGFFDFPGLHFIESIEESKKIDHTPGPKIIIAGSGMSTAGRILFHEKRYLSQPTTIILMIGYQVRGTLGRQIQDGAKNVIIEEAEIPVRAKVETIESYSAHADQQRLKYWLSKIQKPIKKVLLVHGESAAKETLLHRLEEEQGLEVEIPKSNQTYKL